MKIKRLGSVILNTLLYLFLAVCVVATVLTVWSKKDGDGAVELFGYQMRVIVSDSMAACDLTDISAYEIGSIPLRSMVFVQVMPQEPAAADAWYRALRVGDVLTFRYVYTNQVTITHRIVSITEKETGGFLIELAGDNRNSDSAQMTQLIDSSIEDSPNYVIGRVTGQAYLLGFLVSLLKSPLGIIFLVIVPCFLIILLEVIKIVGAFSAEKKQREQAEKAQTESELEALRRRLAELETQKAEAPAENGAQIQSEQLQSEQALDELPEQDLAEPDGAPDELLPDTAEEALPDELGEAVVAASAEAEVEAAANAEAEATAEEVGI